MKIALKTYCFNLSSAFLKLQTTKGPHLMPARGGTEEWQQKRFFMWVFQAKNDQRKIANDDNQTYLWTSKRSGTL